MELADISGGGGGNMREDSYSLCQISLEFLEDYYHAKRKDLENERCLQAYKLKDIYFFQ